MAREGPAAWSWRRGALVLFHLGLVLAAAQVAVSLETATTLSRHGALARSVLLLLYPVALTLLGCGAVLDRIVLRSDDPVPPLRAGGLALVVFLFASLRWNFLGGETGALWAAGVAHVLPLAGWFLCVGVALARVLRAVRASGAAAMAGIWAVHQAGLVAGYLVQDALVPVVGANALVLLVGLSLLPPAGPGIAALALGCALAPAIALDARLEGLRAVGGLSYNETRRRVIDAETLDALEAVAGGDERTVHAGWSRFGQFRLVAKGEGDLNYSGWYNFTPQWDLQAEKGALARFRARLYALLEDGRPSVIIGVGAGRGLFSLPVPSPRGLRVVERDPEVVRYFRDEAPDLNDGLFREVRTFAEDGRRFVERSERRFSAIVVESARYQPASSLRPASAPFYLYTRESLRAFVRRLAPEGWMALGFSQARNRSKFSFLPDQVLTTLREEGLATTAVELIGGGGVHVVGCRGGSCLERLEASGLFDHTRPWVPTAPFAWKPGIRLTDDMPFVSWILMKAPDRDSLWRLTGALLALCAGGAVLLARRSRARPGWDPVPYFFSIGFASSALLLATFHAWRTFYQDEMLTVSRVLAWLIAFGAGGSLLAPRLRPVLARAPARLALAGLGIGLHVAAWRLIPFGEPSPWVREAVGALLLLPGGLAMGVFFPVGWMSASRDRTGVLLMADALGTLAGYLALYWVLLPFGVTAYAAVACAAYLLAAAAWREGEGQRAPA